MRKITLQLSPGSCDNAIRELQAYERDLRRKLDEICRRLADIGAWEARTIAYAAASQGLGNDDVAVSDPIPIENGYKIAMSGEDIYFIEFGTGIFAGEYAGDASNVSVGIMPGDWSDTHARLFSDYGYWFYAGQKIEGTPAYMPMYYAGRAIRENMKRIAEEVFAK